MEPWKIPAFAAAVFAGLTSVIAKAGLKNLSADIGLTVRTTFVAAFAVANFFLWADALVSAAALRETDARTFALLALSAFITALSWVCCYRAMKDGTVTFVSVVDKGSILVTLALCVMLLGEPFTWRIALASTLIIAGLLVLAGGKQPRVLHHSNARPKL